ncbi:hypothetical protein FRC02_003009 [Tulasnella sp. 418]|nr:hypothetical protein FRC02_003009 [Tulasnella sp. 418]
MQSKFTTFTSPGRTAGRTTFDKLVEVAQQLRRQDITLSTPQDIDEWLGTLSIHVEFIGYIDEKLECDCYK